jgi:hypothetical protein
VYAVTVSKQELCIYVTKSEHIVRMSMVPFSAGEIFWLRTLLYRTPSYSFVDLRTVDGVIYTSFQAAAAQRKFAEDLAIAKETFHECLIYSTPHELRVLFVNMTIHGFPTVHLYELDAYREAMSQDFFAQDSRHRGSADNKLLLALARCLKQQGNKTLDEFGLPMPQAQDTELQIERLNYRAEEQARHAASLVAAHPLTEEMQQLFDDIVTAERTGETFSAIIQGVAGTGKSTFVKYVMAYFRSLGHVAKGCASTGLAAAVYDDFSTAHSLFAIPVMEDEEAYDQENDFRCRLHLPKYAERMEVLEAMKLLCWDEISSQHMRDVNAVRDAMNRFLGKISLWVGDGMQTSPVIKGGHKSAICASSIYCSSFRQEVKFYRFTKILRLENVQEDPQQASYARMLKAVSTNTITDSDDDDDEEASPPFNIIDDEHRADGLLRIYIPNLRPLFTKEAVVSFAFPYGFDLPNMHKSCILATTNEQVEAWNAEVQQLNPQPTWTLLSRDSFGLCDDPHGFIQRMVTPEVMHQYTDPSTAPPHELQLKVDDVCILMRAVSKADKLATNTRVRVCRISNNIVRVCTLGTETPRYANLCRFVFSLKLPYGKSYEMTRRQFPLRLAYSLTINRSQGKFLLLIFSNLICSQTFPLFL